MQFAAGNNIKAGTLVGQRMQDCKRGIGFYGEADLMIKAAERALVFAVTAEDGVQRINVSRSSVGIGNVFKVSAIAKQSAPAGNEKDRSFLNFKLCAGRRWSGRR